MGKETVEKLRNIGETMTTMEMVQKHGNVKLPPPELLCVTHGTAVMKPVVHVPAAHMHAMIMSE